MGWCSNPRKDNKMTINYKKLGKKIKGFRLEKGLSQEQLAELCDLSTAYISLIETGKRKINFSQLEKIAQTLELSIDVYSEKRNMQYDFSIFNNYSDKERKFLYNILLAVKTELQTY